MKRFLLPLLLLMLLANCSTNIVIKPDGETFQEIGVSVDAGGREVKAEHSSIPDEPQSERITEQKHEHPVEPEPPKCTVTCVETIAGIPWQPGYRDGPVKQALIDEPRGMAMSPDGELYFVEDSFHVVRKLTKDGLVVTVAGTGEEGSKDGPALKATFDHPTSLAFGPDGQLYISDHSTRIRKLTKDGQITTFAGTGEESSKDGPVGQATFQRGQLFLAPGLSNDMFVGEGPRLRRIDFNTKMVSTFVGSTMANLNNIFALTVDPFGNIYCIEDNTIRKITKDKVTIIAGQDFAWGYKDGPGQNALFNRPIAIVSDGQGQLYVGERSKNNRIRKIDRKGYVTTFAGSGESGFKSGYKDGPLLQSQFVAISSMVMGNDGYLYVSQAGVIRRVNMNCKCHP